MTQINQFSCSKIVIFDITTPALRNLENKSQIVNWGEKKENNNT